MKGIKYPTISVCVSVNTEAMRVQDLLDSIVDFADEIIISDTGSQDNTPDLIRSYIKSKKTKNIFLYHYKYDGRFHYGEAKNFAMSKASKDYILVLDADERLSQEFKEKIKPFLFDRNPDVIRIVRYDDLLPHLREQIERIVKRKKRIFYATNEEARVHEFFVHSNSTVLFDPPLWHCQREKHWLLRPHSRFLYLELEIDRTPKTKSFIGHMLRSLWMFQYKFRRVYFSQQLRRDGRAGLKYAFLRAWYAFLIQMFVGLKQEGRSYWGTEEYKERIK